MNYAQTLNKEYQLRFGELESYRLAMWKVLCEGFFQKYIPKDCILLDLGSGYGEFILNINAKRRIALDLNPHMKDTFEKNNIEFLNQDCTMAWDVEDESIDIVFSSNFLEHLMQKSDIEKIMAQAFRVLKKGGHIILLGPNIRFVYDDYWDYWDHHLPLSDRSVREILRLNGFSIIKALDRFLPYSMSGEGKRITPPMFCIKAYLMFPLVWKFFGKQFFIVAQK